MRGKFGLGLGAVALAAALSFGGWANQAPDTTPQRGMAKSPRIQAFINQLNLTDSQKTQLKGFMESARTQAQAVRNDASLTPQQRRDQLQAIAQQRRQNVMSVLTPDQQAKAQTMQQQAQDRFLEVAVRRLKLTDSQRATVKTDLQNQRTQVAAVRNNASLTPQQKVQQIQSIRQQTADQIRSVLTPDQQQKLSQMRQNARMYMRGWRNGYRHGREKAAPNASVSGQSRNL